MKDDKNFILQQYRWRNNFNDRKNQNEGWRTSECKNYW